MAILCAEKMTAHVITDVLRVFVRSRMETDDFSDVLDMEYLLLSDASSVTDRNDSRQSETSCEFEFVFYAHSSH